MLTCLKKSQNSNNSILHHACECPIPLTDYMWLICYWMSPWGKLWLKAPNFTIKIPQNKRDKRSNFSLKNPIQLYTKITDIVLIKHLQNHHKSTAKPTDQILNNASLESERRVCVFDILRGKNQVNIPAFITY